VINRATAGELFKIIDTYLKDADLKWRTVWGSAQMELRETRRAVSAYQARLSKCPVDAPYDTKRGTSV